MTEKSKVFISYSRVDTKITNALARDLMAVGVDIWMDREDITVGERWSTAIQAALEEAQAMILILSPDSMASDNVEDEFTYFLDQRKPIIPVMVRETKLHFQLHRLQWIDFTQGDRSAAYRELIRALDKAGVEFAPLEEMDTAAQNSIVAQMMDELETEKRSSTRRRMIAGGIAAMIAVLILLGIGFAVLRPTESDADVVAGPQLDFVVGQALGFGVAMYEQPSRDAEIIVNTIPNGAPLIIFQRTADQRFYLAEYRGTEGFVLINDVAVGEDAERVGVYVSPTPQPTGTPTPFITATPTPLPTATPEQVTEVAQGACVVASLPDAQPHPVYLGPSEIRFSALDTIKPSESFDATARTEDGWYYIGIGWLDGGLAGISLSDPAVCAALDINPMLEPNRIRLFIKDLFIRENLLARDVINVENLTDEQLTVAWAWNNYGGLLANLEELISVDENLLLAAIVDETRNEGNEALDNRMQIRFEADIFESLLPKEQQADFDSNFYINPDDPTQHQFRIEKTDPFMDYHGDNNLEWQAFELARGINEDAALQALRYGETGLLGASHAQIGYLTPLAMYDAYMASLDNRVIGRLDYIKSNTNMLAALNSQAWGSFGQLYDERVGLTVAEQIQADYQIAEAIHP